MRISSELPLASVNSFAGCDWTFLPSCSHDAQSRSMLSVFPLMYRVFLSCSERVFFYTLWWVLVGLCSFNLLGLIRSRVAGAGFCQEPITVLEGSWSAGKFYGVYYLECPSLHLLFFHPNGTAGFELPFCAGFCCPPCSSLPPPCFLVPWRLMDCWVLYVVMD